MAARSFKRSLEANPKNWKAHSKLLEALVLGEKPSLFEKHFRNMILEYPDSARSNAIIEPGMKLIGEDKYNKIAGPFELKHLGNQLARKPKNMTLLARCIMAGCRAKDKVAVEDYYKRAMSLVGYEGIDDSLLIELRFFIGKPRMDLLRLDGEIESNPQDIVLRKKQLQLELIMGDTLKISEILAYLAKEASAKIDDVLLKSYGYLVNTKAFKSTNVVSGWDASLSPDKKTIIFIRDLGNEDYNDLYIYRRAVAGGEIRPVLKASQHNMQAIAWPVFSPDGKWIYFYGSGERDWKPGEQGEFYLYRMNLNYGSRPRKLTDYKYITTPMSFTSDGDLLLVRRDISSVRASADIVRFNPNTRKREAVSRIREFITGAVFTPSGDSLLFITPRGIFSRSIDGGKASADLSWLGMKFPQLSNDGRLLKLVNKKGHVLMLDRQTGLLQFLGRSASSSIAFARNGEMLISRTMDDQVSISRLNFKQPQISLKEFKANLQ